MSRVYKTLCLLLGALSILPLHGQLRFAAWSSEYMEITSYLGLETNERFNTFQFQLNGIDIDQRNWSLSVRLLAPIEIISGGPNRSGKSFPADKISFRWTVDDNHAYTNLNSIGVSRNDIILQNATEVMLIRHSQAPIQSYGNYYSVVSLFGAVRIGSGKYLDDYTSPDQYTSIQYRIPLLFTLYDDQDRVLGTQQLAYTMRVAPRLTDGNLVDVEPDYSLQIGAEAANATLNFLSGQDYADGVSETLKNAIKIHALTNFEVRVKALDAEFMHPGGAHMPLSILSLQLSRGQDARAVLSNPTLTLSADEQVALSGTSDDKKNAQYFNLQYKANLTRSQVLSSKTGTYTVSLLYLLVPR